MNRRTLLLLAAQAHAASQPRTIVSKPGVHYGFPRIVQAANGHFLLFYRIGNSHAYDHSSVALRRSTDRGVTWGPEQVLFQDPDPARSAHNPVAIVTSTGRILLWLSRFRFAPLPHRREPGAWAHSDDHGATWSPFETFDSDPSRSSYYMTDVIRVRDGILGCMATFPSSGIGNCYAVLWHSADNGISWSVRSQLTTPQANRGDEVALLERSNGDILCLLRTRRQPGSLAYPKGLSQFLSTDRAQSWQELPNLHSQLGLTLQRPFLTRLSRNQVLLSGRDVETREIVTFFSNDEGSTLHGKKIIDRYAKDGAYTTALPLSRKEVLLVYYADREGALAELRSVRIRLT